MSKQYLFSAKILNKKNFNPLNIVAYYSGQVQLNAFKKEKYMPDSKKEILHTDLLVPQNQFYAHLPDYLKINNKKRDIIDNARNILWNNVDFNEKRMDAQFARVFEVTVPSFLELSEVIDLTKKFAQDLTRHGIIVDVAVHKTNTAQNELFSIEPEEAKIDSQQDYSCYFMCTLRDLENGVFINKNRDWNTKEQFSLWRKSWLNNLKLTMTKSAAAQNAKKSWESRLEMYPEFKPK